MKRLLNDDGSATITATGIIASVVSLAVVVAALGAQVADSHRACVAADLAAVAGADALYRGHDGCAWAEKTAVFNHAELTSCELDTGDVIVEVQVRKSSAKARAGP